MAIQKWSSSLLRSLTALALSSLNPAQQALAWGVDGHHMINRLAGANLPGAMPSFLRCPEGLNSLEYYAPEPDHCVGEENLNWQMSRHRTTSLLWNEWLCSAHRRMQITGASIPPIAVGSFDSPEELNE